MKRKMRQALIHVESYEAEAPERVHVFDIYFLHVLVFRKKSYVFFRSFQ